MIYLIRHGETEWSVERRHTGRTDIPLTEAGRAQASALAPALAGLRPDRVLVSPLSRARETCELAGLGSGAEVDERLVEWDYGDAEGRTTEEIRASEPGWSVWTHPMAGAEPLESVSARVDAVLADLAGAEDPATTVVIVAHAHLLRILGARWCGEPASFGQHLVLDPASISILGAERENRTIERWNTVVA